MMNGSMPAVLGSLQRCADRAWLQLQQIGVERIRSHRLAEDERWRQRVVEKAGNEAHAPLASGIAHELVNVEARVVESTLTPPCDAGVRVCFGWKSLE